MIGQKRIGYDADQVCRGSIGGGHGTVAVAVADAAHEATGKSAHGLGRTPKRPPASGRGIPWTDRE